MCHSCKEKDVQLYKGIFIIFLKRGWLKWMENCCICGGSLSYGQPVAVLTQKGSDSINRVSDTYGDHEVQAQVGQSVHQKFRRDFCRPKKSTSKIIEEQPAIGRRSVKPRFSTKEHCFFCGQPAKNDGRKRGNEVIPVRTQDFQDSIAQICKERNDEWSEIVLGRLEYAQDLHAADAVYHQACSVNFRTGKQVPLQHCSDDCSEKDTKRPRQGRPVDTCKATAFLKVVKFLEENTVAQKGQSQISLPKHKSIFQNTNQFTKTQNNFSKHKSVYQNTKQFPETQINFPKHKSVYQNTKQFLKTQTNFVETQISLPKHKSISQNTNQFRRNTNQKTGHLLCYYQRAWKGLIPRIFRVQHGDFR